MKTVAQIILVRPDGALILRHIDKTPDTPGDGVLAAFGGTAEANETPRTAAVRLVNAQTNLELAYDEVTFWREYPAGQHQIYVFMAQHIPSRGLGVLHSRGFAVIHNDAEARKMNMPPVLRRVITDHYHERRRRHKLPRPQAI
jgi:ADP-ribose pyrophosphatase YjhB (NUDIX family)